MSRLASNLGTHVAVAGIYRGVSLHMGKSLEYQHPYSTQRFAQDQGDGQFARGYVSCNDAIFSAKKARADHPTPGTGILDTEKILMGEWGTGQRLRSIDYKRTTVWAAPAEQNAADYFANVDPLLFAVGATTAFPVFSLWAEDPDDAAFKPFLLIAEATTLANTEGTVRPQSALSYGVNRRKRNLLIVAQAQGAVPDESGLFLSMEFTEAHK